MSEATVRTNTNSQLTVDYDTSKIFLGGHRFEEVSYTNSTGATVTVLQGRTMAYDPSTEEALLFDEGGAAPLNVPFGVNAQETEVEDGETVTLSICVAGDIAKDKVVPASSIPYFIGGHYAFRLREVKEMTKYDI